MPSLIKYFLFLLADIAIIGCILHFVISMLRGHDPFGRDPVFIWGRDRREFLARSYYFAVMLSVGLALYGSLIFLFLWMPHRWVTYGEEGDPEWIARVLSALGAFAGMGAFMHSLTTAQAKISELDDWKLHAEKERAFEWLIRAELTQIGLMIRSAERETDVFARLERNIDKAEKGYKINRRDSEVCRDMLSAFRAARGHISPG
jgi:hypothetical protein